MSSVIHICNLALDHLGQLPIGGLFPTERTKAARVCKLHYETARDAVLRDFPWNFSTKTVAMAVADYKSPKWDYAYSYPIDCLKAREIVGDSVSDKIRFKVEQANDETLVILSNQSQAVLEYTAKVTNPMLFDAEFVIALSYFLASEMAEAMTGETSQEEKALKKYDRMIGKAEAADASEGDPEPDGSNPYVDCR